MVKKTKIYLLADENGKIRYIGKTSIGLRKRLLKHLWEAKGGKRNHRCCWIRSLLTKGFSPAITEISEIDGDGCQEEIAWIEYFRDEGYNLVNQTDGGEGALGHIQTEEAKAKFRLKRIGHIVSPETRLKLSVAGKGRLAWNKGVPLSSETKQKLRLALKGRAPTMKGWHHSEEAKQKNRLAHLGKKQSRETILKRISKYIGKKRTTEQRLKMSLSQKGHIVSEETRKKLSLCNLGNTYSRGKPRTIEARCKMSEAHIGMKCSVGTRRKMSFSAKNAWKYRKQIKVCA